MKDGLVNWSKMRQIARHCAIVTDCSRVATEYQHDDNLSRLVTDLPVYSLDSDVRLLLFVHAMDLADPHSYYEVSVRSILRLQTSSSTQRKQSRRPDANWEVQEAHRLAQPAIEIVCLVFSIYLPFISSSADRWQLSLSSA